MDLSGRTVRKRPARRAGRKGQAAVTSIDVLPCRGCGVENRAGVKFCVACGARLSATCPGCGASAEAGDTFCGECGASLAQQGAAVSLKGIDTQVTASRPMPEGFADDRYTVSAFLGEGARKLVYRATDTRLGREVAVAAVKTEGLDEAALTRVWHEARSMARLGDHPNVVTVFDVVETGAAPIVVSQFMAGGSLADRLDAEPEHRLSVKEAVAVAVDICKALGHAHGLGIVHRDLKPANVWLDSDGRALLGDFGLALATDGPRVTVEGMMLGTVAYMPPEQAVGREADARSDLYSLGALLYETLTGRPPFLGQDTVAVISQHLNTEPVLPTWFNSEVPVSLEGLVMELLAKSPDDRPASASVVESRLAGLETDTAAPVVRPTGSTATTWRFVGRESELATLRRSVDAAVGGRGSLVMVVGEPGIGKTRTTEQAAAYASLRGMQVLVGRCYEGDASIPYLPFIEAIRAHVSAASAEQLRSELGAGASDVAKLVSEVRQRVSDIPAAAPAEGPDQERRRLFDSVCSFLQNASAATPIMLVLDDLHWADKPSLLLLVHLTRALPTNRLLVVGTYRDVELDRRHPLSEVLTDLRRGPTFERILLRGLSAEEVLAFLEAAAERQVDGPMRQLIPMLHRETEGNPFFIRELLLHMVFTGTFVRRGDRWELADPDLSNLGIPEGVREVIGRRLSRLSDAANAVLTDAAVLGRDFEFPVLARMHGISEDQLVDLVEEALVSQLIVERPASSTPTYAFSHALVRETLYDELSLPRKQRRHLAAGQALESVHSRDRDRILPVLASHFRLAGAAADPALTLDYVQRAAQSALAVFAWEDAIAHLETALEVMEDSGAEPVARAELATRVGDLIFRFSTEQARGVVHLENALELYQRVGDERRAAQVHSRLGRALTAYGGAGSDVTDMGRGIAHLVAAEKILADGRDRASLVYLYQSMAAAYSTAMDAHAGLAVAQRAAEMSERLGDEALIASSAVFRGLHLASSGQLTAGLELMEWAAEENHRLGRSFFRWCATVYASVSRQGLGDPLGAEKGLRQELRRQEDGGSDFLRRSVHVNLARAFTAMGRLEEAEASYNRVPADPATTPEYLIARGRWSEALVAAEQIGAARRAQGSTDGAAVQASYAATGLALQGRWGEAAERLEANLGLSVFTDLVFLSRLVSVCVDADDLAAGRRHLETLEALPVLDQDLLGAAAYVSRARGVVSGAQGDHRRAVQLLTEAVECSNRYHEVYEAADSLRRRAASLAALDQIDAALADLSACLDIYERAGAGPAWTDPIVAERVALQGVASVDRGASIAVVANAVASDRPDLEPHAGVDGTVTLVFTDLGDSTVLNEKLGDRAWLEVLSAHHQLVRSLVERHGGSTVKSQGDGFMLAFPSARRAVECAIEVQRAASAHKAGDEALQVRIGIHTGEVLRQGEDFFGRHVNLAARVGAAAQLGQILVSSLVQGVVSGDHELHFQGPRCIELKGFDQPESVYEVVWAPSNPVAR